MKKAQKKKKKPKVTIEQKKESRELFEHYRRKIREVAEGLSGS